MTAQLAVPQPQPPLCHDDLPRLSTQLHDNFTPVGRQKYCSGGCRAAAYRRRRDAARPPATVPKAEPRRPITVYECDNCGTRALGNQHCECGTFMRRVGIGGCCPACDGIVALPDIIDETALAPVVARRPPPRRSR